MNSSRQFPIGLCCATLIVTGLGLAASVLGVQWGAAEPRSDALDFAWRYVNVALGATWFVIWPAAAFAPDTTDERLRDRLCWQLAAIGVGAIPALGVAGWLSLTPWGTVARVLAMQMGFAIFVLGALAIGNRERTWQIVTTTLAVIYLTTPALAYLQLEFLGGTPTDWQWAIPAWGLAADGGGWAVALGYALVGGLSWTFVRRSHGQANCA